MIRTIYDILLSSLKYIPFIVVILVTGYLNYYQWHQSSLKDDLLVAKTTELQKANLELGRAHTTITEQDVLHKEALSELDQQIQDEIGKRKALITLYAKLEGDYQATKKGADGLVQVIEEMKKYSTAAQLPEGHLFYKKADGTLAEVTSLKWSWEDFRIGIAGTVTPEGTNPDATIKLRHSISYDLHMKLKAQFIESRLPNGVLNHYAKVYELDDKDKAVGEVSLRSFEVLRGEDLPSKMMWWNPKADMSMFAGTNTKLAFVWGGEVGLSAMAYGKTPNDLRWRFLRAGVGVNNSGLSFSLSPAQYNLSGKLPLVSNTWITPSVGYTLDTGAAHLVLGLSVVF